MEKFSKKRGRPRKIPSEWVDASRGMCPDLHTERSFNNLFYIIEARAALREDEERYRYLFDRNSGRVRKTILSALGRLEDPDTIRVAADAICEDRMKTDEALILIRLLRSD